MCLVPIYVESNPIPMLTSTVGIFGRIRGKGFDINTNEDQEYESYLFVNVKKCFFNDFFNNNKASYLTSLFCTAEQKLFEGIVNSNKVKKIKELYKLL